MPLPNPCPPNRGRLNNLGQIVAGGIVNGQATVLLLTPTPEPGSAALLLGGVALLGQRRRR